jgi:DNA-binding transcriptional LysR family regulator
MRAAEIKSGRLVRLLPDYTMEPVEVHAIFPSGPHPSAKVRAFVDYLASALKSAGSAPQRQAGSPEPQVC